VNKSLDLAAIQQARRNLDRIAGEHPELVDHERAQWAPEDVAAMLESEQTKKAGNAANGCGEIHK